MFSTTQHAQPASHRRNGLTPGAALYLARVRGTRYRPLPRA